MARFCCPGAIFLRSLTVWGQFCGSRSIRAHKTASRRGLLGENYFSAVLKPLSLKASRTAQKARQ
ncbi:MAG: hypothetical protein C7B43_18935 [Sulfobacillus benefaciens]|uniref:Uncharacterized protein n=1 Tax=Sulfobacillus benefaciens TaxID=453960 RepID=A0A2T2WQJ9_9FIRM|nr:MAG: hypothetical protein C7B43_18935 [Sulfobacillus benefaciens]